MEVEVLCNKLISFVSENRTFIEDVFYADPVHRPKQHKLTKREVESDEDQWDTGVGMCDAVPEGVWTNVDAEDRHSRTIRNAEWTSGNTNEYFVKVLIVADKSMLEHHGTYSDLQHYILTLMHTVRNFNYYVHLFNFKPLVCV